LQGFSFLINDERFVSIPKILETPKSEDLHEDVENLRVLMGLLDAERDEGDPSMTPGQMKR